MNNLVLFLIFSGGSAISFFIGYGLAQRHARKDREPGHVPPRPIPAPVAPDRIAWNSPRRRLIEAAYATKPRIRGRKGRFVCVGNNCIGTGYSPANAFKQWNARKQRNGAGEIAAIALAFLCPDSSGHPAQQQPRPMRDGFR